MEFGIIFVAAFVALIAGISSFIVWMWLPNRAVKKILDRSLGYLRSIEVQDGHFTDLDGLSKEAFDSELLDHPWNEFRDTLHEESETGDLGKHVVRYRQTLPAEVYFSDDVLVNVPLRTEFFKHFPGVLTACGIIATFAGLIIGLTHFNMPTGGPESDGFVGEVNENVADLISSVWHAFILSALFILLAVAITLIEKAIVSRRMRQAHELCVEIDRLFDAGAGEDYLSRLVDASESSATKTAQLKDQMVEKLEEIFDRQTSSMVEAIQAGSRAQVEATKEALAEPLSGITAALNASNQDTGAKVQGLITEVLNEFMAKLDDTFGAQVHDLNTLMQGTSSILTSTSSRFDELAQNVESAGTRAAEQMGQEFSAQMSSFADRQQAAIDQSTEAAKRVADTYEGSIEKLSSATNESLDKIETGSAELLEAMSEFNSASTHLRTTVAGLGDVSSKLLEASQASTEATTAAADASAVFKEAANEAASLVSSARELSETVSKEARVTEGLVAGLREAADSLAVAQTEVESYLGKVSDAIGNTHEQFATALTKTLGEANVLFNQELSAATAKLAGATKELQQIVEEMATARRDNSEGAV